MKEFEFLILKNIDKTLILPDIFIFNNDSIIRITVTKNSINLIKTIIEDSQKDFMEMVKFFEDMNHIDKKIFGKNQISEFLDFIKYNYDEKSYLDVEEIIFRYYL